MKFKEHLLRLNFDKTFFPPVGSKSPHTYVVSNFPSPGDFKNKKPFSDFESETYLMRALKESGHEEGDVRLTYACPFKPPIGLSLKDTEIQDFAELIKADIRKTKPKVILCLGVHSAIAFGVTEAIKTANALDKEFEGIPIIFTRNTSFVFKAEGTYRGGNVYKTWLTDFTKARNIKTYKERVKNTKSEYEVLDVSDAKKLFEIFPSTEDPLVLDYEASGLDTMDKDFYIGGVGLHDIKSRKSVYVNLYSFERLRHDFEVKMEDRLTIGKFLSERNLVVYNMQYECSATIGYFKYELKRVSDVLQYARCMSESGSLKEVASRKLLIPIWNDDVDSWVSSLTALFKEFKATEKSDKKEIKFIKEQVEAHGSYNFFDLDKFLIDILKDRVVKNLNKSYKSILTNKGIDKPVGGSISITSKYFWRNLQDNDLDLYLLFQETKPSKITYDDIIRVTKNPDQYLPKANSILYQKRELVILESIKLLKETINKYFDEELIESVSHKFSEFFCDKADRQITDINYCEIPFDIVSKYCVNDVVYTGKLYTLYMQEFKEKNLEATAELFNRQARLGVELEQNGIAWDNDKADELDVKYLKQAVQHGKSLLLGQRMKKILDLTSQDELVINTATTVETIKSYFNPDSTAVSSGVRTKVTKLLCSNRVKMALLFYNINTMALGLENPDNLSKTYPNLYYFLKKILTLDSQEEALNLINKCINTPNLITKFTVSEKKLFNVYFSASFELDNLQAETLGGLYDVFKLILKVDIENDNTWLLEFKSLLDFILLKKILKSKNTYINGKLGKDNVYIVNKDSFTKPYSERVANLTDRKKTDKESYINKSSFGVTTADTKRWKSGTHTIPSGCLGGDEEIELHDGSFIKIKSLVGAKPIKVKSHTDFRSFDYKECNKLAYKARITKKSSETIKLILSDGNSIICTPDHRFLLKSGSWKEARFLTEKDELLT